ncbi:HRDC domain-containing protein [Gorillibacterium timonense]|uniref:HRDC domain-containing protein n=1 Tax=Gorillibacterium timonense TaxID=1689269 RepID=UPI00071DD39A|nr:HRDC domain-containing protein [Gorillibacterium timonense]
MALVFLNSFERKQDGQEKEWAKVTISQQEEAWQVLWLSQEGDGMKEEEWFLGSSWKQLLEVFRIGLKCKLAEGYIPLIETRSDERTFAVSLRVQRLYCYSENHYEADAFEKLRLWRREQAKQESKSAYILASNRILQMIAAFLPHTVEELAQIPGIGGSRLNAYGDSILAITREYVRETPFPLDWVSAAVPADDFAAWQMQTERERSRQQADKLETRKQLLEHISQGLGLGALAKSLKTSRKDILTALEELDRDGYDIARLVETELQHVRPEEQEIAEKLFKELGDRYLKPVVSKLLPKANPGDRELDQAYEWLRLFRMKYRRRAMEGAEFMSAAAAQA